MSQTPKSKFQIGNQGRRRSNPRPGAPAQTRDRDQKASKDCKIPAPKERKNAAHGASRGWGPDTKGTKPQRGERDHPELNKLRRPTTRAEIAPHWKRIVLRSATSHRSGNGNSNSLVINCYGLSSRGPRLPRAEGICASRRDQDTPKARYSERERGVGERRFSAAIRR